MRPVCYIIEAYHDVRVTKPAYSPPRRRATEGFACQKACAGVIIKGRFYLVLRGLFLRRHSFTVSRHGDIERTVPCSFPVFKDDMTCRRWAVEDISAHSLKKDIGVALPFREVEDVFNHRRFPSIVGGDD